MNIFHLVHDKIKQVIEGLYPQYIADLNIVVETPKDRTHGDVSTSIAMMLQKKVGSSPRAIAEEICKELLKFSQIESAEIAGPGFINLKLSKDIWHMVLKEVIEKGGEYGTSNIGFGKKVNIEFVSANPTGPMHIGHSRGAIIGDATARLMQKCGYNVTKEYYINDAGSQITTLVKSVYIRYLQELGVDAQIPEGAYPGEYLIPVAQQLKNQYGDALQAMNDDERNAIIRLVALNAMMELIKSDLALLKVHHDIFISEYNNIHVPNKVGAAIELLKSKGLIYHGILEAPKGKQPEDWEEREQMLFSSTKFGDDVDRALAKSSGEYTYFAADIAYHFDKISRGFDDLILFLGADHSGYVKRMKAVVGALSDNKIDLDVKISQLVNLFKDGKPYKMSKRSGNFVTVSDVVEELGADVLRFMMLTRKNDTVFDFHLEKAQESTKDNPVFYVQYANARANSVMRIAADKGLNYDLSLVGEINDASDLELIKKIAEFPKAVENACIHHEPHRITFYLIDLANEFHSYWAKGNDNESLRFIQKDDELTKAKLLLAQALINTISSGLDIIGVAAIDRM